MKRILLSATILLAAGAFMVLAGGASNQGNAQGTYTIELDNAFGLVPGADFKVAGVRAGAIQSIDLCFSDHKVHCQNPLHAVVTVQVTQGGFGSFRSDAFCQTRPQSLIGEYFVECQPGQSKTMLKNHMIPVTQTYSTVPADLLQNVMRMPYRERFTLIINELGAAVAGRSGDLQAALQRAVPALTQTDNLLNLLANDSHTLQALTTDSNSVITALANNSTNVQRFILEANNAATHTANQQAALQGTFQQLPGFLEQLRPTLAQLGAAVDKNEPVLANLKAASGNLNRLFTDLPSFKTSALPALKSLGQASVTGKAAAQAAGPLVQHLNQFAQPTPELAQNLAIVLNDLDNRSRAVEADPRSPGGKGYTGLEALLQYVFNQTLAINLFGPLGHVLVADTFVDPLCSPYASPGTVASSLKQNGAAYRRCYSWLGPNQQGINETDPSNPGACVPDPGGAPPGMPGPQTTACRLPAAALRTANTTQGKTSKNATTTAPSNASVSTPSSSTSSGASSGSGTSPPSTASSPVTSAPSSGISAGAPAPTSTSSSASLTSAGSSGKQAAQLLNYLLAP